MFLHKTRQNFGPYLMRHLMRWSSGINDKSAKEIFDAVSQEDKILSDEFRAQLPYIKERNKSLQPYKLNESVKKLHEPPFSDELSNILDLAPEENNCREISAVSNQEGTTERPSTDVVLESEEPPPKSLPVMISSFDIKTAGFQWDLTAASLPISLHRGEDNFLTVAVAKDIKHTYFKTLETAEYFWMQVQNQGSLVRKKVGLPEEPGMIGSITREKAIALIDKGSIWLSETPTPKETKTEVSLVDNIKKTLEKTFIALKSKLEEQKKAREEKKEEPKKTQTN